MERPVYGTQWAMAREGLAGTQRILDENDVGAAVIIPRGAADDELISYPSERYPVDESVGRTKIFTIASDGE
jgi:hypothetical protein